MAELRQETLQANLMWISYAKRSITKRVSTPLLLLAAEGVETKIAADRKKCINKLCASDVVKRS